MADVLLLAGSADQYVSLRQFYQQARVLKRARSLTGRIFTRHEQAQNHCQIGSIGRALQVILHWLDGLDKGVISARPMRALFDHPQATQFTAGEFCAGLEAAGLRVVAWRRLGRWGIIGQIRT